MPHTPNGYDPAWIAAINGVLADRGQDHVRISDLTNDLWERFIGPMVDAIEDVEVDVVYTVAGAERRFDDDALPISDLVTCGTCERTWDDAMASSWTPAPSGRCPFEYQHGDEESADG